MIIPTILVTALCVNIWRKKLLPPMGEKSRSLLFYFARLIGALYIVFGAVLVSSALGSDWVSAIAFTVFKLVGLMQVCLALLKKDVKNAWVQMWCCRSPSGQTGGEDSIFCRSSLMRRFSIKSEVASISGIPYKRKDEITPQGTLRRFSESSFDAQKAAGTNISGVPNDEGTGSNEVPDEKQRGQL